MKALVSFNVIVELDGEPDPFLSNNPKYMKDLREKILNKANDLKDKNMLGKPAIINADFDIMLDYSGAAD